MGVISTSAPSTLQYLFGSLNVPAISICQGRPCYNTPPSHLFLVPKDKRPFKVSVSVHATIHESKIGVKLGDTFWGMCTLINPLDWSQNSTAILQAASRADLPN